MLVTMSFKVEWQNTSGEKLEDFAKKYIAFKRHVEHLQMNGSLPLGETRWITKKVPIGEVTKGLPVIDVEVTV